MIKDAAQWVGIAKDALTGLAAMMAALVAVMGLKTWKRQLLGNANYDLSRRLLRSMYKLREAIKWMRNPFMSTGEMSAAMNAAGLSESDAASSKVEELAYQARWQKLVDAQLEFAADVLEAEALWGPSVRQKAEDISSSISELYVSVAQWLSQEKRPLSPERHEKIMAVIYDTDRSNDFSAKLKSLFDGIEAEMRSHLRV